MRSPDGVPSTARRSACGSVSTFIRAAMRAAVAVSPTSAQPHHSPTARPHCLRLRVPFAIDDSPPPVLFR